MSSKPGGVFPAFGGPQERRKAAGFQRLPPMSEVVPGNGRSEPFRPPSIRAAVAVQAVAVKAAIPAAAVAIPVHSHAAHAHAVVPPAALTAEPAFHMGQNGKAALLAVIERLVERIGRI